MVKIKKLSRVYIAAIFFYVLAAVLVIHFSPVDISLSDVLIAVNQGVDYLLKGMNPYGQVYYVNIYQVVLPFQRAKVDIITKYFLEYPPLTLFYYLPFRILGDVRYGNLVADVAIFFTIIFYFKKQPENQKFALLFLANGINFYLNYISGVMDIVPAMFLAFALYFMKYRKNFTGIFYGFSLMAKQLTLIALPFFLLKLKNKFLFIFSAALVAILFFLPFMPNVFIDTVIKIFYPRVPLNSYILDFYPFFFMPLVEYLRNKQKLQPKVQMREVRTPYGEFIKCVYSYK